MELLKGWKSYELLDTAHGEKLERFGEFLVQRPDPQVIWPTPEFPELWKKADAVYHRSESGGGSWEFFRQPPSFWSIDYAGIRFGLKAMGFKHTGVFPEQSVNWDWMRDAISLSGRPIRVLNLFGYTGGATLACAQAGASVCHVDASKGMVTRARGNAELSRLAERSIRYICDDALSFVEREIRRGRKYEGVVMDPPSFGRGPKGEVWKIEEQLFRLIERCRLLLSEDPLFFLVNSYTTGLQPGVLSNLLELTVRKAFGGSIEADDLGIPVSRSRVVLPAGCFARWKARS